MHLNPPSMVMFLISAVLAGAGVISKAIPLPFIGSSIEPHAMWVMLAAYLVLAFGCLLRGL